MSVFLSRAVVENVTKMMTNYFNCFYYIRLYDDLLLNKNTLCGLIV